MKSGDRTTRQNQTDDWTSILSHLADFHPQVEAHGDCVRPPVGAGTKMNAPHWAVAAHSGLDGIYWHLLPKLK